MNKFAVYCGRFNPIHVGHEAVINDMVKKYGEINCLIVVGSSNADFSLRHFFNYQERRNFIKKLYPKIKIVGLPDFPTDEEWLVALDDLITALGINPREAIYFGGCKEDIVFFAKDKRHCQIMNRFDGTTPKISATEIRDCLIYHRSLKDLVNDKISPAVEALFKKKWEKFKRL
jgi:nicotinamide mononucleotide adenylyltransferase